jgi:chromosome segregation protein
VELSHFNQLVAELESRTQTAEGEQRTAVAFEAQLQEQIKETEASINNTKDQLSLHSRQLDAKQNEYNLTKSMVDNLEGFPESIRFLKKHADWAKHITLFSDILFCREEYRIAVENYLEPLMNYFVVEDYDQAIKAINLLGNSSKGRAQFFILNHYAALPQSTPADAPTTGWLPALSVVEIEPRYKPLCNYLLRNVYLVNDTTENDLNTSPVPQGTVLLGKSGKFSKSVFSMAGGSVGLFEGKRIGRAKNLENLAKDIRQTEQQIGVLKAEQENLQSKLVALKASGKTTEIQQKQQELNRLHTELVTVTTRREQYQTFITNSRNRKDDIAQKISSIQAEEQKLIPQVAELKTQKEIQSNLLLDKQEAFNELNEYTTVQSNAYNQENIRFHQQQNKVSGLVKDLEYRESQLDSLEARLANNAAEMEKVQAALLETLQHTDFSDDELLDMYTQREELEKATKAAEQEYYTLRGNITEKENDITQLRRQKDQADVIENELKDKRTTLKLDLNALKERLSVEFNIDINDLLETEIPDGESEQDLRERTDKLKKQLDEFGAINPMALEAFKEMNERYEFIQGQKKDLMEAKASLLSTIQEIDDTAKEKFMSAFIMVRENFIKVFRSLFNEEDSCDLILTDPNRPLESDIDIIAKPKGKRPLSINQLSGGEKTLTATAILFSLYLLKPAPFCIFDEVDAPLDDTNIDKFNKIIRKFSANSQFIVVSHNKRTIASTDVVYGVTMVEQGISRVVPVDLRQLAD